LIASLAPNPLDDVTRAVLRPTVIREPPLASVPRAKTGFTIGVDRVSCAATVPLLVKVNTPPA
jgi:hypothetical protein